LRDEIRQHCQSELAVHKIPAVIRFVPALDITAAGKMVRARG
jgi:acyl-CoA synthetase (AMP-forming)/AMP-acid ligase II